MAKPIPGVEIALADSGRVFKRWTECSLTLRMDGLANAFAMSHVDKHDAAIVADSINEGERVRFRVNRQIEIDGYAEQVELAASLAVGPMVQVAGRSRSCDLVDCPAQYKSGYWEDASLIDMAKAVCEPFGIDVKLGDTETIGPGPMAELTKRAALPFRRACVEPGETAAEFLDKLARERGLALVPLPSGDVAYTLSGSRRIIGQLAEGRNIGDGGRRVADSRDRFSTYRVFGQSAGDQAWNGEKARGGDASVEDEHIKRYRPMIVVSDGTASGGDYERRAVWERNRRAARGRRAQVPVLSWLDPEGNVWAPNRLIDVHWPQMRIHGTLLIEAVHLTYDETGDTGTLELVHPGAYDPLQNPKTSRNRRMWAGWGA